MTDPQPPVGGHGPHDDQPHWTVEGGEGDEYLVYSGQRDGDRVQADLTVNLVTGHGLDDEWAYAALVRAVRDAAEVPALRTHATTLQRARELAWRIRQLPWRHDGNVAALLDLLTGETDGE